MDGIIAAVVLIVVAIGFSAWWKGRLIGQGKIIHHLNDLCLTAVLLDKVFQTSVIVIRVKLAPKFHVSLVQVGKVRFNLQAVHVMGLDNLGKQGENIRIHERFLS